MLQEQDDSEQKEIETKKNNDENKAAKSERMFQQAAIKFKANQNLTRDDIKWLLRKIPKEPNVTDSPIKDSKTDLVEQLQRRRFRLICHLDPTARAGHNAIAGNGHNASADNDNNTYPEALVVVNNGTVAV
jgi:hypothetical protein